MGDIRDTYPTVYGGGRRNKPHSQTYRDFASKWGSLKTLYEIADEKIEKVGEIYQIYLNDYFQYLSYMIEKADMDDDEQAFQDALRKAKSKK